MYRLLMGMFAMLLLLAGGCETLDSDGDSFGDTAAYTPVYILSIHEVIPYPRGIDTLERRVAGPGGRDIYYNANQIISSAEHIEDIKVVPVPGKPERCRVLLKLTRRGALSWQIAYHDSLNKEMIMLLDGSYIDYFRPASAASPDQTWFELDHEFDSVIAAGLQKYGKKNYEYFNPSASNWF